MTKEPKTYLSEKRILVTSEFIDNNNLSLISSKEAKLLFDNTRKEDMFGFSAEVILDYLNWDDAKEYFKDEYVTKVELGEAKYTQITTIEECAQDFFDYMNFAWGKAQDQRGISASRSITKLSAWLLIMGRKDLSEKILSDDLYNPYGAPALIAICDEMGIQVPDSLREFAKHPC